MHAWSVCSYPDFAFPFSLRYGARSFGLVIKELWHLLMREEGFSKRVLVKEKSKYTLRGANAGSLPRLWCIHIIDALLHTHRSSELLHNTSASTVSLFLSSEIILGLQNHKQDRILHIGGDCRRHHSPLTHVFDCRFLLLVHCSDTGKCNGSGSGCPAVHHQAGPLTGMWDVGPVVSGLLRRSVLVARSGKAIKVGDTGKGHGSPSEGLRKEVCHREEAMRRHMHRTSRNIQQEWICSHLWEFAEEYYFKMICLASNSTIRVKWELLLN